ncbi:unnamed protein product [Rotaria sp. Silwood2]|nr:unnamed protein product [Rotaria sp. Silwood2]CAF2953565.1 unnamed protein product [Rotaria sp. Silwood2]CAF3320615.1 unnamed protein product [Rotaria sp. Silwood2]CAF3937174.1 unnamed protein product [Rotaria sp. Silwood2]CAF4206716.1 unnamed protein product [Rotaria sp. Silwood2]
MDETTIAQLIEERRNARQRNPTDQVANRTDITIQHMQTTISDILIRHEQPLDTNINESRITTTAIKKSNKRKTDAIPKEKIYNVPKSSSQLSFVQSSTKKMKKKNKKHKKMKKKKRRRRTMKNIIKSKNHRQSAYLKVSWNMLMNTLKIKLKHPLKKRNEQKFVYTRLHLFNEEFTLDLDRYLWQSYLDIGSQQQPQIWPSEVCKMAKTNESDLCKQYIVESLNDIKINLDLCCAKLNTQAQSWISTLPPREILDDDLKRFVHLQNKHLSRTIDKQLIQYKNIVEEKKVLQQISLYLTANDQILVNELINLQQIQTQLMEEFVMLEQRILCKLLPCNFDSLDRLIQSRVYTPLMHDISYIEFKNQSDRIIQQVKRTWLNIYCKAYEMKIQEYEEQYKENLHLFQLRFECKNNVDRIFRLDSIKIYLNNRKQRMIKEIFINMSAYRRKLLNYRKRLSKAKKTVDVSPQPIFYLLYNPFNDQERDYLCKGPNYIRINQSALRSYKKRKQLTKKEHDKIINKVKDYLAIHYHIDRTVPIYDIYSENLQLCLDLRYMTPLSMSDRIRAQREKNIVKSIHRKLKKYKYLIRVTDKSGVFCVLRTQDHEQKAIEYREKTKAYKELSSNPFEATLNKVIRLLNDLHAKKGKVRAWQYKEMWPNVKTCKLAYMYFNPKTHKDGTPFRPIMHTIDSPTTNISRLLDRLIRPIFNEKVADTSIIDGAHLIKRLRQYANYGHLKPTTLFCTFDINNLYTMLPQQQSLDILVEFLQTFQKSHVQGMDLPTIRELARIVIEENVFVYRNKYYQQIIGGAMGSPFTLTLANIFMWKWEKESICKELPSFEIYGRYIDDIFFTWNDSQEKLEELLNKLNCHHPNIKLEYKIGQCLPFLDVILSNNNGILSTSVYHKAAAEPYVLPFASDHPHHIFRNIIRAALVRAIRYSSTFEAFNIERRNIRLMLLYNG